MGTEANGSQALEVVWAVPRRQDLEPDCRALNLAVWPQASLLTSPEPQVPLHKKWGVMITVPTLWDGGENERQ